MTNISLFPGTPPPEPEKKEPNPNIVSVMEQLLAMAKDGRLQSFIGTGYTIDSMRLSVWCDYHKDVYQMRGALSWLESEYVFRHTE